MTIEKFVHLSQEEKNKVLIKTMELMVELESMTKKQVKTSGSNPETYKKYVDVLNKIRTFLMSEAVAADPSLFDDDTLKKFQEVQKKLGKNSCIYAGWVSTIYTDASNNFYCLHPSISPDTNVQALYKKINDKSKCAWNQIACNPMVFGLKKAEKQTSFCVDVEKTGTTSKSHNASYECMQKALEKKPKDLNVQDNYDDRLSNLSSLISVPQAKETFNQLHDYIFKSCVCVGDGSKVHKRYQNYMRPHRTCLGMVMALKELKSGSCEEFSTNISNSTHDDFMKKWNDFFTKNQPAPTISNYTFNPNQQIEKDYKGLIDSIEVKAYCDGKLEKKKEYDCKINCKEIPGTVPGNPTWDCQLNPKAEEKVFGPDNKPVVTAITEDLLKPHLGNVILTKGKVDIQPDGYPKFTCEATIIKEDTSKIEPICTTECKKAKDGNTDILTCSVKLEKKEDAKPAVPVTLTPEIEKNIPKNLTGLKQFPLEADGLKFSCPVVEPTPEDKKDDETDTKSCEIKVEEITEGDDKDIKVKASVIFSGFKDSKDPEPFSWSEGKQDEKDKKIVILEKKTEARKVSVSFGSKNTEKCEADVPILSGNKEEEKKEEETKKYTIEAKAESYKDTDTNISVKAIVKDQGKEVELPAGYKISWTRNGAGASKIKAPAKDKTAAIQDENEKDKTAIPAGQFATGTSVSAQRVEDDYTVVASLLNADGKEEAKDDEKIPLLSSSDNSKKIIPRNYGPSQGGAAPPSSGAMDTSAGAITE
jgi:hypothetical protein